MRITIEFLAIIIPLGILLIGFIWHEISKALAIKKYNQDPINNDKSRKFERAKAEEFGIPKSIAERIAQPPERSLLQTTKTVNRRKKDVSIGETSNSNGKISNSNPFRRN